MKRTIFESLIISFLIFSIVFVGLQIPRNFKLDKIPRRSIGVSRSLYIPQPIKPNNPNNGSSSDNISTASQPSHYTSNWAGYTSTGGYYTSVSASWTVSSPSIGRRLTSDATWVGIGGISTNDLIQAGTQNIVLPNGQVQTTAFYETLPNPSQVITSLNVEPGDNVSVLVNQVSQDEWLIKIKNTTTNQIFSTTVNYASSNSSAEWIEEDPSTNSLNMLPLDNFGTITFNSVDTTDNGQKMNLITSKAEPSVIVNNLGQIVANTSSISSNGYSFSVDRTVARSSINPVQFNQFPGIDINPNGLGINFRFGF
jgi:hypothetical protein